MSLETGIVIAGETIESDGLDLEVNFNFLYQATDQSSLKVGFQFFGDDITNKKGSVSYRRIEETGFNIIGLNMLGETDIATLPASTLCLVDVTITADSLDACAKLKVYIEPLS